MKRIVKLSYRALVIIVAQIVAFLLQKRLEKKNIWIFSEKKLEARDNGYHFFKFIRTNHPEIKAYYVIDKRGADVEKVKQLGSVIDYDSFRHCVCYFVAKERICSQIHGVRPFEEYPALKKIKIYRRKDQRQINLKHGISKDYSPVFDFRKMGYDLYIAGVKPEYDYIKALFNYPDKNIVLSGFCRFDAYARIFGASGTGRNNNASGRERVDFRNGKLVVANDSNLGTQFADKLEEVV